MVGREDGTSDRVVAEVATGARQVKVGATVSPHHRWYNNDHGYIHEGGKVMRPSLAPSSRQMSSAPASLPPSPPSRCSAGGRRASKSKMAGEPGGRLLNLTKAGIICMCCTFAPLKTNALLWKLLS